MIDMLATLGAIFLLLTVVYFLGISLEKVDECLHRRLPPK